MGLGIQIGIDVGYSKSRKTCGVAVSSLAGVDFGSWLTWDESWTSASGRSVRCMKTRLASLVQDLPRLATDAAAELTIAIDGPLGPDGPPQKHRHVDRECMRDPFRGRAIPASVVGGGRGLVEATYRITKAVVGADTGAEYVFGPARRFGPRIQLFETMPTVGLAVLLERIEDVEGIPSRRCRVQGVARQKSDFYWETGANRLVAGFLGCPGAAEERDHDRRAALYCLAVAMQIDGVAAHGAPVCAGDPKDGVYVLAGPEHPGWSEALSGVGRVT